jgi:hypothetical protein
VKKLLYGLAVLLLLVAAYSYIQEWRAHQAAKDQIAALELRADSLRRAAGRWSDSVAVVDRIAADRQAEIDSLIRLADSRAGRAGRQAATLTDSLFVLLEGNAAARALLREIRSQHHTEVSALRFIITQKDSLLAVRDGQLLVRDSALLANVLALEDQVELTAYWKKEANPPLWTQVWRDLPKYAVSLAVGLGIGLAAN